MSAGRGEHEPTARAGTGEGASAPREIDLVLALRERGDADAFVALMARHGLLLASFLGRLFGGPIDEIWPVFVDRLRDRSYAIRDPENFHLWALGIAAALWREEERRRPTPLVGPRAFVALSQIAPALRPVFVLVHYCGLSVEQAAHALRITRATALTRLHDALASLVAQLAPPPPPLPEEEAPVAGVVPAAESEPAGPALSLPVPSPAVVVEAAPAVESPTEDASTTETPAGSEGASAPDGSPLAVILEAEGSSPTEEGPRPVADSPQEQPEDRSLAFALPKLSEVTPEAAPGAPGEAQPPSEPKAT